jgi:four helix bundle protein
MRIERRTSNVELATSNGRKRVYDLEERLLEYAARICRLTAKMSRNRAGNHVAKQLLRSGTSPLPNHGEAQAAESREDFLHKMRICLKELRETKRWLLLAQRVPLNQSPALLDPILQETEELIRIFVASIRTAVSKQRR